MHENMNYTVKNNKLYCNSNNKTIENPAILIDRETGTLLKVGDIDFINKYLITASYQYNKLGLTNIAATLMLINFNKFTKIDNDGIATIINYFSNTIGADKINEILSMNEKELIDKIASLQKLEF